MGISSGGSSKASQARTAATNKSRSIKLHADYTTAAAAPAIPEKKGILTMKYIPVTEQQRSGAVADLNKLCSTVFEMDTSIIAIEVCADKARCILDYLSYEDLGKKAESLTDQDKWAFIHSYKAMQVKTDILSDYLFEIEKNIKELDTLHTQAAAFFQGLDRGSAAIEYKRHTV